MCKHWISLVISACLLVGVIGCSEETQRPASKTRREGDSRFSERRGEPANDRESRSERWAERRTRALDRAQDRPLDVHNDDSPVEEEPTEVAEEESERELTPDEAIDEELQ